MISLICLFGSDVSDDSELDEEEDAAMANEMRDAIDDADMETSSSEDDDGDEQDLDEDNESSADAEEIRDEEGGGESHIQAEINAALENGQLEVVDDVTGQMISDQMDLLGEQDEGGMIQTAWGHEGGFPDEEEDMEGGDVPDGDDLDDDEDEDGDDGDLEEEDPSGNLFPYA